jgi:bacillithiol system protein YtxJ
MYWKQLEQESDIATLVLESKDLPQVIFKHSTRCSISSVAFNRVQSCEGSADFHMVNVISSRAISNRIADTFGVLHQSPQLLVIHNGKCSYTASHFEISAESIDKQLSLLHNMSS